MKRKLIGSALAVVAAGVTLILPTMPAAEALGAVMSWFCQKSLLIDIICS